MPRHLLRARGFEKPWFENNDPWTEKDWARPNKAFGGLRQSSGTSASKGGTSANSSPNEALGGVQRRTLTSCQAHSRREEQLVNSSRRIRWPTEKTTVFLLKTVPGQRRPHQKKQGSNYLNWPEAPGSTPPALQHQTLKTSARNLCITVPLNLLLPPSPQISRFPTPRENNPQTTESIRWWLFVQILQLTAKHPLYSASSSLRHPQNQLGGNPDTLLS